MYVEIPDRAQRQTFDTAGAVELYRVAATRRGAARRAAGREPAGRGAVRGVSGEANAVQRTRRHLVRDRGFDKAAICFTGYWSHGMSEEAVERKRVAAAS
ncbi:SIP domain-containing protein [Amycolatopsis sp. FDAARGOS 1241]|uniref:SIP domain-containing protein n=1 Tax=Amycolatopsis sp. FDAARGOS 1241 TaxID=2778070 RepID=UPI0021034DAE|nr:SIP domain-containing protein [Amycolatopsis sp. FDAARGOS 1241]